MSPEMKPEHEEKRPGSKPSAAQSTVEPEPVEESEEEYDDEAEGEYQEEPSIMESTLQFASEEKEKEFIQEAVEKINSMYRQNVDNGKLEIGSYLLDRVFGGNVEEAISTNPYKSATFSRIAGDPNLVVEPKTLGAWVRASAINRDFSSKNLSFPHLTTYHLVELAKVKDENRRAEIAQEANDQALTVKDLRRRVIDEREQGRDTSGRLKQEVQKTVKDFAGLSINEDVLAFVEDKDAIKKAYSPGKALDLIPEVYSSLESVQAAAQILETFANNLDEIVNETRKRRSA